MTNNFFKKPEFYLRIENENFGFLNNSVNKIKDSDILISLEDYNKFFDLQEKGAQFRLKEQFILSETATPSLFDYVEQFTKATADLLPYIPTETELLKEEVETLKAEMKETNSKLDDILGLLSNK